jgi:hypothetical protein
VTDLRASAVADPFLFIEDGKWHLFFEVFNLDLDRGEIACASSTDGRHWNYLSRVLSEPFHLSYPQVFKGDDGVYMIPETRQAGEIRLYRTTGLPGPWVHVGTLLRGPYADATILRHKGKWWLFAQRGLDEMCLLWSQELGGPWHSHPSSPLYAGDRSRCRPGGRILNHRGSLIRFVQDAWPSYGRRLRAFSIDRIDETHYEEHEFEASPVLQASLSGWNAVAMHHIDAIPLNDGSWLAAVDGAHLELV